MRADACGVRRCISRCCKREYVSLARCPASFGKLFLSLHAQSSVPQRLHSNALSSTISPKSWGN